MRFRDTLGTILVTTCLGTTLISAAAPAKEWTASLAHMPVYAESTTKGVLIDFTQALAKASGDKINIQVVPFARSIRSVAIKQADFHIPLIQLPGSEVGTTDFDYSSEIIFHVNFVLYSTKGKDITRANIQNFKIETDAAHTKYFHFPIEASASLEQSLRKVNAGRIDGFIFADFASDPIVKANNMKNIKRSLYERFNVRMVLPKGGHGGDTDKFLSAAIKKLQGSGEFVKLMGPIDTPFDAWQP